MTVIDRTIGGVGSGRKGLSSGYRIVGRVGLTLALFAGVGGGVVAATAGRAGAQTTDTLFASTTPGGYA